MSEFLTTDEADLVKDLGEIFNQFLLLPKEHANDAPEFCSAIHVCQNMILSRPARRQMAAGDA